MFTARLGWQPALVINGEHNVLPDDGEKYTLKLLEADVRVTTLRYHGTIHDYVTLNASTNDLAPRGAIEQTSHMLRMVMTPENQ